MGPSLAGIFVIGLACFWLALIGVVWGSFGGFFTAIFALAYEHVRSGVPAKSSK